MSLHLWVWFEGGGGVGARLSEIFITYSLNQSSILIVSGRWLVVGGGGSGPVTVIVLYVGE